MEIARLMGYKGWAQVFPKNGFLEFNIEKGQIWLKKVTAFSNLNSNSVKRLSRI